MNTEVSDLVTRAGENVRVARIILAHGSPSIACSRAYYAMFYVAEAWLLSLGQCYSSHRAVTAAFGRDIAQAGRVRGEQHQHLIQAFEARQVADYGDTKTLDEARANRLIEWAEEMIRTAEDHLLQGKAET